MDESVKPPKNYQVMLPDAQEQEIWDEAKYNRNKDSLFNDYKNAVVVETSPMANDAEIDAKGSYIVGLPGEAEVWDGEKLARNREQLLKDHPDVQIQSARQVNYWGDKLGEIEGKMRSLQEELKGLPQEETPADPRAIQGGSVAEMQDIMTKRRQSPSVSRVVEINRELNQLRQMRDENPAWQQYKEIQAEDIKSGQTRVEELQKQYEDTMKESSVDRALSQMDGDYLKVARRFYDDARKAAEAPTRQGDTGALADFWQGVKDTGWSAISLVDLARQLDNVNLLETVQEIQRNEGKDANIRELVMEHPEKLSYFSDAQKEMLRAFIVKGDVEGAAQEDLSRAYQAGQGAAKSLGFMADFMAAGGLGEAAAKKITGNLVDKAGRRAMAKIGAETLEGIVKAGVMTPLMPSSYSNFIQNITRLDDSDGVDLSGQAIAKAAGDVLIENISETVGAKPMELIGKPLSKVAFPAWAKAMRNSPIAGVMKQAGYNGFLEEMVEEWTGNAMRVMTGVDKDALSDFATLDQQLITAASFAPMALFGLGASTVQFHKASKSLRNETDKINGLIESLPIDDDAKQAILASLSYANEAEDPEEFAHRMTDVSQQIVENGGDAADVFRASMDYATAASRYKVMNGVFEEQKDIDRNRQLMALDEQMGNAQWHHYGENGSSYVRTITDQDGNERFVVAEDDTNIALVDHEGKPMFMSKDDYAAGVAEGTLEDSGETPLFDYLDKQTESQEKAEEQVRMENESRRAMQELQQAAQPGVTINVGTVENPVNATIMGFQAGNYIVQKEDGTTAAYTPQDLATVMGIRLTPETDAEIEAKEVTREERMDSLKAQAKQRRGQQFAIPGGDTGTLVSVARTDGGNVFSVLYDDAQGRPRIARMTDTDLESMLAQQPAPAQAETETGAPVVGQPATEEARVEDTTPRDFRGNPLPLRTNTVTGEHEVDENALWNNDPEAWVRYNDGKEAPDVTSAEKLEYTINDLTSKVEKISGEIRQAVLQGADQAQVDQMRAQQAEMNTRLSQLQDIFSNYSAQHAAEAEQAAAVESAPAEPVSPDLANAPASPEAAIEESRNLIDSMVGMPSSAESREEYDQIMDRKASALQQMFDALGAKNTVVTTMSKLLDTMKENGATPEALNEMRAKLKEMAEKNEAPEGFHDPNTGKIYMIADFLPSSEYADRIQVHEEKHMENAATDAHRKSLATGVSSAELKAVMRNYKNTGFYDRCTPSQLADEVLAVSAEIAETEGVDAIPARLRELGVTNEEFINFAVNNVDNGRRNGQRRHLGQRDALQHENPEETGGQDGRDRSEEPGDVGESGLRPDEGGAEGTRGGEQPAESGRVKDPSLGTELSEEVSAEMREKGLVLDGGAVMDEEQGRLKQETGYKTPNELDAEGSPIVGDIQLSITTIPAWARSYMSHPEARESVVKVLENLTERMAANELVYGVVPRGVYKYGQKSSGSKAGPLRTNIEYVVTFDMDTSCPRSLQYLEYVKKIEAQIGRPLTQTECIQLIEMMRVYGQMIPCVYCYCENKRQALKQYYTDFMTARHAVISAKTEEKALAAMYGHKTTKEAKTSNDPAVVLSDAAYKVFQRWRAEKQYNPTLRQLWAQYRNDRNVALTVLDGLLDAGRVSTMSTDESVLKELCKELGITGKEAQGALSDIVSEWKWNRIEDRPHDDFVRVADEDNLVVDENTLALWREMTLYGKSASQAKNTMRYVPYTDELKTLSQEERDYINGMGGLRMHSSNDFRIDYVLDYFQFMADMEVERMMGHTYTKSPEFVRIFGNSGYKINMSIAAYEDSRGIHPNSEEGFDWTMAKELRAAFPNAGVMLMATSDAQVQFALDSDWIDMFIPFHASSLPKAVWYNMRHWTDYSSTQNERFLNGEEMRTALEADGVSVPKGTSAEKVEDMYIKHFNIKVERYKTGKKKGKRIAPHFLPGETIVDGVKIPGHNNDYARYIELCRQYGVHPRFYGMKVRDNTPEGGGRIVDITEHPQYMKCIKETARTDTPQTPIHFNFDEPSEALGGLSPIDYAMRELEARAMAEGEAVGSPVRNIYESYKQDPYGIVPQFINGIIKHKETTGKDLPLDYLTPDSRKWAMTERKALEEAYKDFETIPYHPHEYDEDGNLIMKPESAEDRYTEDQKKAIAFVEGTQAAPAEQPDIRPSVSGRDQEYLDAVQAGDMEKAQEMVRDAFKEAFPNTKVVDENGEPIMMYHGSAETFTIFDTIGLEGDLGAGSYFTNDKSFAESYTRPNGDNEWRIDSYIEKYFDEHPEKEIIDEEDYKEAEKWAKENAFRNAKLYPVYLNIENPRYTKIEDFKEDRGAYTLKGYYSDYQEGYDGIIDHTFHHRFPKVVPTGAIQVLAFNPSQIKSADPVTYDNDGNVIPLSERFNPDNDDIRFSLRGPIGALQDADAMANLAVAKNMEAEGKDAKAIWAATGWEKGADGEWRNEIPDAKPKMIGDVKDVKTLSDIVDAPELFESYPSLKKIKVEIKKISGAGGYLPSKKTIELDRDYCFSRAIREEDKEKATREANEFMKDGTWRSYRDIDKFKRSLEKKYGVLELDEAGKGTLLHEMQHAIQEIEGFAKGGNTATMRQEYLGVVRKQHPELVDFARVFSARNSATKLKTVGKGRLLTKMEEAIPSMEGEAKDRLQGLRDYMGNLPDSEYNRFVTDADRLWKGSDRIGKELYRRLAGEVEARNVERRSGWSEEERRATPPSASEDYARSDQGVRFSVSADIAAKYPNWMDNQTSTEVEGSKRGQNTQVAGTVGTYKKVGSWIDKNIGKDAQILDASSGLGLGTLELRSQGFNVDDIEPYPGKGREEQPTYGGVDAYQKAMDDGKEYDYIISNAVLNVIPDDWRDGVLNDMATLLKPGGRMFINTRKAGEEKTIKNKIELESPQEVLVGTPERITSYQRFFTPSELKEYVEKELGEGYTVEIANEKNSGTKGLAAVVVKKGESPRFSVSAEQDREYMDAVKNGNLQRAQEMVDEVAKEAGYDSPKLYHGSNAFGFTSINTQNSDDGVSFWATNKESVAGSYTKLAAARRIGSEISAEEYDEAVEKAEEALNKEIRVFRNLIDRTFSEWYFGQQGNDGIRKRIMDANHESGYGDGVYDVLEEYVEEAFENYGQDLEEEYEDFSNWAEDSPEAQKIFAAISSLEGLREQIWQLENGELSGGIYELYANTDNMFVVDAKGAEWNALHPEGLPKIERGQYKDVPYRTRDVVRWAMDNGYDGVVFKNIRDNGQYGRTEPGDVYAFTDPQRQVKSSDPVTFDDNGHVIPLSERFNPENNDIRFSVAYHGTGADFERFDHSHMGEGEGAQAYGWGTYVTTNKDTGITYAKHMGGDTDRNEELIQRWSEELQSPDITPERKEMLEKSIAERQAEIDAVLGNRHLYTVEIPDDNGENYLHWDEPITRRQARKIMDLIRREADKEEFGDMFEYELQSSLGPGTYGSRVEGGLDYFLGNLYDYATDKNPGAERNAKLLNSVGIIGMQIPIDRMGDGRYEGSNYVLFDENNVRITDHVRFSVANAHQEMFVSNAQRAVENIRQEKATPEQWLKMVEKNGGLKAGEDKWLGLSQWLKDSDKKTLTKQEVLDFIEENKIKIEETRYGEEAEETYAKAIASYQKEYADLVKEGERKGEKNPFVYAYGEMGERYGDDFDYAFERNGETIAPQFDYYGEEFTDAAKYFLDQRREDNEVKGINATRMDYTTRGLNNKREIALTVPTIDPWNQSDNIHFGDAGEGRAVAWVRFGDASIGDARAEADYRESAKAFDDYQKELQGKYLDGEKTFDEWLEKATPEEREEFNRRYRASSRLYDTWKEKKYPKQRVLFIDEIQSKRHQEGREKGYLDNKAQKENGEKYADAQRDLDEFSSEMAQKYGGGVHGRRHWVVSMNDEEKARYKELEEKRSEARRLYLHPVSNGLIPAAPFEKNWQELAMKRMLRLAAEEGYDYVAWTKGEQQAERYNLSNVIHGLQVYKNQDGTYNIVTESADGTQQGSYDNVPEDKLADYVGKEMAVKIVKGENEVEIKNRKMQLFRGLDLKVGGEGMKGFYDEMLPRFMNKYGKQWGVKVEDITLPGLENGSLSAHAVPVTQEMKDSVMEGQPMFSVREEQDQPEQSPVGYGQSIDSRKAAATDVAEKCGVQVEFKPSSEMQLNGKPLAGRWENGRISICPEHCRDTEEVIRTVLHEGVGHNGLRRLVGDRNMSDFCLDIFRSLPDGERATVADSAVNEHGGNVAEAVEEYLARKAETMDFDNEEYEHTIWDRVRGALRSLLTKVGINVPLSENDVRWLLWQSFNANRQDDAFNEAKRQTVARDLGFTLHQQAEETDALQSARNRFADEDLAPAARLYNRDVVNWMNRLHETWVDKDDSVIRLVEALEKATGKKAAAFEDVRLALNQQSSKGLAAIEKFEREHYNPMMRAIKDLMKSKGCDLHAVERYVMIKHGLERNEVFARRDAREYYRDVRDKAVKDIKANDQLSMTDKETLVAKEEAKYQRRLQNIEAGTDVKYRELRNQDYGGLTAMYSEFDPIEPFQEGVESEEEYNARVLQARHPKYTTVDEDGNEQVDMAATEAAARQEVEDFENGFEDDIKELWWCINGATKATLKHQYDSNMISRAQYNEVKDMFQYYVPLRGFADKTAEDMYDYYRSDQHNTFTPPLQKAKGRKTESESPFGYIGAMASSAIAADMKNETKLALYYFVSNRAANDLVTVSEVWYEKVGEDAQGKSIFEPVYPPFTEGLNSEEAKKSYEDWEKAMQEKAKSGVAFKGTKKLDLKNSVIHIDDRQKASHVIKFKVGGRDMMMFINGNPRAAQAINNELNVEMSADYQKVFGKVLRWFSGINTSYNPEFWLSNAQRDILFALMGVNVKENAEYNKAFRKTFASIIRKTLTPGAKGGAYSLKRKFDEGELGDEKLDRYYEEFVDNGGVTGYTVLKNNEEWEAELRKYTGPERTVLKGIKTVFEKVQNFGEAIEQMSRFAAYATSRDMGKDIKDAVNDAKELTVNFNRKGSGKAISFEEAEKLRTKDGKKLNLAQKAFVVGASWIPVYGRRFIMFFNAAVQGLNAMYKLVKKDPGRLATWTAGYFALGVVQALIHAMLDDDDDYLDIPDYERRNNLLIGGDGYYFKWALPQESRIFYAVGDMAVNHMLGREPHRSMLNEVASALADIAPLNPAGGISALAPSAVTPFVEVALNRDFKGAKIYNDLKYLSDEERERTPSYQKAYPGTGKAYVAFSQFANWLSGGDYADAGWININPAAVEHILQGATGGAGTTLGKLYRGTVGQVLGEEFMVRNTPFLGRLLTVTDERYRNAHTTDLFDYYKAEAEHTKKRMKAYRKAGDDKRLNRLLESDDYQVMNIYESYKERLKWFNDELKATTDQKERRELMKEQDAVRKDMIMEISNIGNND